jgi:hypothetical protein
MPEQTGPLPADVTPAEPHPNGAAEPTETVAPRVTPELLPPFVSPADILEVSPLHREVITELRWAYEQCERGAFDAYLGQYLAIVNKTVQAVGDPDTARDEAARKAGVAPERVAMFYVGGE